jgi:hypothetical protein
MKHDFPIVWWIGKTYIVWWTWGSFSGVLGIHCNLLPEEAK